MNDDNIEGLEVAETVDIEEQKKDQLACVNKEMERNGTMLFVYQLVMLAVVFLVGIYMTIIGMILSKNSTYIERLIDNTGIQFVLMITAVLIAYIPVYFYMKRQGLLLQTQLRKTESNPKIIWIGLILVLAASSVGSLVLIPIESAANWFGYTTIMEMEVGNDAFYYISSFLYVVIIGPIVEELVYRGGILMALRRFGDQFAVVVSAIIFGLMHANIPQIIFATLVGLILGYICVKTNSLRYVIIIHMLNNLIATIMSDYLYPHLSGQMANIIDWVFILVFLVLGALILYRLRGHLKLEQVSAIPLRNLYRSYFTSIPMILLLLFFLGEIILSISRL